MQLLNTHDHGSNHVPKSVLDGINDEVSTRSTLWEHSEYLR